MTSVTPVRAHLVYYPNEGVFRVVAMETDFLGMAGRGATAQAASQDLANQLPLGVQYQIVFDK